MTVVSRRKINPNLSYNFSDTAPRACSEGVFEACRFDANVEAVAHLALVVAVQLAAQKGHDVVGLHRVDGVAGEILIDGAEFRLAAW